MRILTLFSGTHSIGKTLAAHFPSWEETTLDLYCPSTFQCDILTWNYKQFAPGHFDVIWASPDCVQYSKARYSAKTPRNIPHANSMVLRTLEIIDYLQPQVWFLENPSTGLLLKQPFMQDLQYSRCDYCMYGNCFKKATAVYSNITEKLDAVLKTCNKRCGAYVDGKHISSVEYSAAGKARGAIPIELLRQIFLIAEEHLCQKTTL